MFRALARLVASASISAGLVAGAPAPALGEVAKADAVPAAVAADLAIEGAVTRIVFTLSQGVVPRTFAMERPDRLVVELPEVNFQLPADAGRRRQGLVASFRTGLFAPGRSRIVIDLAQPAAVSRLDVTARPRDGAALLTIELTRVDREAFRRLAQTEARPAAPARPAPEPSRTDRRPVIVIDAGHGGIDPGAAAPGGALEKDIVFGFAGRLHKILEATGRYRVASTRDRDVFVSLDERVRLARQAKADLFISLHADTISGAPQVRGLTVYTGAEQASDADSATVADRENKADAAAGHDPPESPDGVADILQELTIRETRGFSHRFAGKLIGELEPFMRLNVRPRREARFRVLRAPDVPAVLVELGYLSSPKDVDLLMSDKWRDRTAGAITAAIDRYFGPRAASREAAAVSP